MIQRGRSQYPNDKIEESSVAVLPPILLKKLASAKVTTPSEPRRQQSDRC